MLAFARLGNYRIGIGIGWCGFSLILGVLFFFFHFVYSEDDLKSRNKFDNRRQQWSAARLNCVALVTPAPGFVSI